MQLSDVLSKPPTSTFKQVDGFLKCSLKCGKSREIAVGKVRLNYFCKNCDSDLTFLSSNKLFCIGINDRLLSIDCALSCSYCGQSVPVWFLVECKGVAFSPAPEVRILKRSEKLSDKVQLCHDQYGDFSELLEKSERAYRDELGAGSIVYLRKILERITVQTAEAAGIETKKQNGNNKPFKEVLEKVDSQCSIIPKEFTANGYRLFGELSDVLHGNYDEQLGLQKYEAFHCLVVGVLDNVKNNREMMAAIGALGWNKNGGASA